MPTALDTRDQLAPAENPVAPPQHASRPARRVLRIHPTRDVAGQLGRYVSAIVAKVRATFDGAGEAEEPSELIIDLSDAAELPQAQLTLLLSLLRPIVGNGTTITLSGVRPMILGSLVAFDLPADVVVVDTRGRTWTNASDHRRADA